MTLKKIFFDIKLKFANRFFKDAMNFNAKKYLEYNRYTEKGLRELYSIKRERLLDELKNNLKDGVTDKTLFVGLFEFYKKTCLSEFNSMNLELCNFFQEIINEHERQTGLLVNKEQLYFFKSLINITAGNIIVAMACWELGNLEKNRLAGNVLNITNLINELPVKSIKNTIDASYNSLSLLNTFYRRYPTLFSKNFIQIATELNDVDGISFLSCGLKNIQALGFIKSYNNTLHINRIFAQEIINSLCIINESIIKDYPEVASTIPSPKKRQIGTMLSPVCLGVINPGLSSVLGTSTSGYTGMYSTLNGIMNDATFNTDFPNYLNDLEINIYSIDVFKARILVGIHSLRNKVLHDNDDSLCYYSSALLFEKTVGLLFAGVTVTKNLR